MSSYPYIFSLPADFYTRYWQREPLVIRQAIANFRSPVGGDDLAGLACLDGVESRIVLERGGSVPWEVRHGPFREEAFAALPDKDWTLLVQAVDHWDAEVMALRRLFPSIPNWRIDDVMVSYAAAGGSVGPHADSYDVFLLQGEGRRRWRLGGTVSECAKFRNDTELQLLSDFESLEDYLLNPGDALYVPPGTAHWGVAEDECVTYSIGFRAPTIGEILDAALDQMPDDQRYRDPAPLVTTATHPGEITSDVVERLHAMLLTHLTPGVLAESFGALVTQRKYPADEGDLDRRLEDDAIYKSRSDSRFAFIRRTNSLDLYVDGDRFVCPLDAEDFIRRLCDGTPLAQSDIDKWRQVVAALLHKGALE